MTTDLPANAARSSTPWPLAEAFLHHAQRPSSLDHEDSQTPTMNATTDFQRDASAGPLGQDRISRHIAIQAFADGVHISAAFFSSVHPLHLDARYRSMSVSFLTGEQQ